MRRFILQTSVCILSLFTLHLNAKACSCNPQGAFLKVAPKAEFVALVKIVKFTSFKDIYESKTPMSMEVEVIEKYKGKETRKIFTVWGDNGMLCRPYLSEFKLKHYYVIAFYPASDGSKGYVHEKERPSDYSISICGDYWLNADLKKQMATGNVFTFQKKITLKALKEKLSER